MFILMNHLILMVDESIGCLVNFTELTNALFFYSTLACNVLRYS